MKYNLKISLPVYKIIYSIAFMFVMALIRPTVTPSEILMVIEPNICFLAIVFIADIFYCEFKENRINVFYLFSDKQKYKTILQRFIVDFIYLILLVLLFYWFYVLLQNTDLFSSETILIYGYIFLSCFMTVFFFSVFSLTLTNIFQNMWAGIGITLTIWFVFNTKIKEYLPLNLNIFAYEIDPGLNARATPYFVSRILYMIFGVLMLIGNYLLVKRSPMGRVREGKK